MRKSDTPAPISAVLDIPAGRVRFIRAARAARADRADRADTTAEVLCPRTSRRPAT
ncbi:hypothetical protein [Streptomyces sp. NPDC059247]|uniref:hypothetical protein n=1 Tax=Streptomyces sp. NPDC059247 TaxID=3346790 RepID=UPI0036A5BBED